MAGRKSWLALACVASLALVAYGCGDDSGTSPVDGDTPMDSDTPMEDGDTPMEDGDTPMEDGDTPMEDGDVPDEDGGMMTGPMVCLEECENAEDCTIEGTEIMHECVDGRCEAPTSECEGDDLCTADRSGWTEPCTEDGDCGDIVSGDVCVAVEGAENGRCAPEPVGGVGCAAGEELEREHENADDGEMVTVCGTEHVCSDDDGMCYESCAEDEECTTEGLHCNTDTDRCEACTEDEHCGDNMACHTDSDPNMCVCANDEGCPEGRECRTEDDPSWCACADDDVCNDNGTCDEESGHCTCDAADDCRGDTAYEGTELVCEPS